MVKTANKHRLHRFSGAAEDVNVEIITCLITIDEYLGNYPMYITEFEQKFPFTFYKQIGNYSYIECIDPETNNSEFSINVSM